MRVQWQWRTGGTQIGVTDQRQPAGELRLGATAPDQKRSRSCHAESFDVPTRAVQQLDLHLVVRSLPAVRAH